MAAFLTRSEIFAGVEFLMHLRYRIMPVVAYRHPGLVDFFPTVVAKPYKYVLFCGSALTFKDDKPGILLDPRRVRRTARTKQHLAGFDDRGVLLAVRGEVNQILHTRELQSYFVAGINMKIFALFAAAAEKRQRFGILPHHSASLATGFDFLDQAGEIDWNELFH